MAILESKKDKNKQEMNEKTENGLDKPKNKTRKPYLNEGVGTFLSSSSSEEEDPEKYRIPERRFCEICGIYQPYRTKHSHEMGACVAKFDHHCFWIGGCVGELNHGSFWLMLLFFNIEFIISLYYVTKKIASFPHCYMFLY